MRILSSTVDRHTRIAGIVGSMLVASVLTSGAVAAADPSPTPDPSGPPTATDVAPQPQGGTVVVSNATAEAMPAYGVSTTDDCATVQIVGVAPDGSQTVQTSGPESGCGSGMVVVGGPGTLQPFGQGGFGGPQVVYGGPVPFGAPGMMGGTMTASAYPARIVTVTNVAGDIVSLKTDDGWTRDLDTSNVVITLDKDTLTAADLAVGDRVLVDQVQNANDTWTITGLELQLPEVMGVVTDVTADGFTVTGVDGTTTVVRVSDATTWPLQVLGGPATGLDAVQTGDIVDVRGKTAEDGSMDAHSVVLHGAPVTYSMGGPGDKGAPVPAPLPAPAETPAPTPTPAPSSAP